eukprot:Skav214968  [mRNA]  locus=scaffold124:217055:228554:- [translate_table: standard]
MERPHDYGGDSLEDHEAGESLPLDDSMGDADLAAELGVAVQALPVEPISDSQIPETQLDESLPEEKPSVPCDNEPEQTSDGQEYILPDELPPVQENPSSSEEPPADLPDTQHAEWLTPTELDDTPSPPRPGTDGVVEVFDSPRFPTRVLPPTKPVNLDQLDAAALQERILQIKQRLQMKDQPRPLRPLHRQPSAPVEDPSQAETLEMPQDFIFEEIPKEKGFQPLDDNDLPKAADGDAFAKAAGGDPAKAVGGDDAGKAVGGDPPKAVGRDGFQEPAGGDPAKAVRGDDFEKVAGGDPPKAAGGDGFQEPAGGDPAKAVGGDDFEKATGGDPPNAVGRDGFQEPAGGDPAKAVGGDDFEKTPGGDPPKAAGGVGFQEPAGGDPPNAVGRDGFQEPAGGDPAKAVGGDDFEKAAGGDPAKAVGGDDDDLFNAQPTITRKQQFEEKNRLEEEAPKTGPRAKKAAAKAKALAAKEKKAAAKAKAKQVREEKKLQAKAKAAAKKQTAKAKAKAVAKAKAAPKAKAKAKAKSKSKKVNEEDNGNGDVDPEEKPGPVKKRKYTKKQQESRKAAEKPVSKGRATKGRKRGNAESGEGAEAGEDQQPPEEKKSFARRNRSTTSERSAHRSQRIAHAKVFIVLILLIGHLNVVNWENAHGEYDILEFYAGQARLARLGKGMGLNVFPHDNILQLLLALPTGDAWNDAELWGVYQYVKGSKLLKLPEYFRPASDAVWERLVKTEPTNDPTVSDPGDAPVDPGNGEADSGDGADAGDGEPDAAQNASEIPAMVADSQAETIPGDLIEHDDRQLEEVLASDPFLEHVPTLCDDDGVSHVGEQSSAEGPVEPLPAESPVEPPPAEGPVEPPPAEGPVEVPPSEDPVEPPSSASTQEAPPPDDLEKVFDGTGLEMAPAERAKPDLPKHDVEMPPPPVPVNKRPRDELFATLTVPPPVLSDQAIYHRLYRVFKPKRDGSCEVDERWVKAWQDVKVGRVELYSMFEKTGYSVDRGVLALGDDSVTPDDTAVIAPDPPDAKEQLAKLGFPEKEGDSAPHAMINKACQCLQKNMVKMDGTLATFKAAESLTSLQKRNLISAM